jgi:hypothetical protein
VKPLGLVKVCVEENFYRVVGPDGAAHNRVECSPVAKVSDGHQIRNKSAQIAVRST